MALPEVEATSFGEHTRFGVRGKTFLYYLDDHHGDGRIALNVKTGMLAQAELVEAAPARFFRPAYLAHQGWTGLELAGVRDRRRRVDWEEVAALVMDSYLLVAPKRLGALVAR